MYSVFGGRMTPDSLTGIWSHSPTEFLNFSISQLSISIPVSKTCLRYADYITFTTKYLMLCNEFSRTAIEI